MRLTVIFGVLAAVLLGAFAVLYFVIGGGSDDESENGLTIEQQSPRIERQQTEPTAPNETTNRTQEEQPNEAEEEAPQENETAEQGAPEEAPVQPEAPQAERVDPFTAELTEGVDEFLEYGNSLKEKFPNIPFARQVSDQIADAGENMTNYDAQLRGQKLPRADRTAKMKARLTELMREFKPPEIDFEELRRNPDMAQSMRDFGNYAITNMPTKLFSMLGTQFDYSAFIGSN